MTRRRCPPPDLHYLEDGFILTDQEARERLTTKVVVNRRNKKIVTQAEEVTEQEYVEQLQLQTRNILLEVCQEYHPCTEPILGSLKINQIYDADVTENCRYYHSFTSRVKAMDCCW